MEEQKLCREFLNSIESLKVTVFWIVMLYSLIEVQRCVGGMYCFQLQVRKRIFSSVIQLYTHVPNYTTLYPRGLYLSILRQYWHSFSEIYLNSPLHCS